MQHISQSPSTPWAGRLFENVSAKRLALIQAVSIGLFAGLATTAFRLLMGAIGTWRNHMAFASHIGWWFLPLMGFLGAGIGGMMVLKLAPEAKGSGIPYIKLVIARPSTPMRLRAVFVKFFGAAIGIGSGLSLGREGPSVQIGAGMGDWVARWFTSSPLYKRQMIAAGAGAGLAAAFNAPIAGMLFVVEEMVQDFSSLTLGVAILSSITASVVARVISGGAFIYKLPPVHFHGEALPMYGLLGLACGVLGPLFGWALLRSIRLSRWADRWLPRIWHPAIIGALTGMVGLIYPEVLGGSYSLVERSLFGTITLASLPFVFLGKLACTSLGYGSGAAGGIFSPSLVLGALVGLGVGQLAHLGFPQMGVAGFAFAGMGAFFAAAARTPVTAIVLVFEMTGDYQQIMPLMLAVVVATLVAEKINPESIYHALLTIDGIHLAQEPTFPGFHTRMVKEVMTHDPEVVYVDQTLHDLTLHFARSRHNGFPVLDRDGGLAGMLTKDDLLDVLDQGLPPETLATQIGSFPGIRLPGEATLADAWHLLTHHHVSRLAVVDPEDPNKLVGLLTRVDLLNMEAPDAHEH